MANAMQASSPYSTTVCKEVCTIDRNELSDFFFIGNGTFAQVYKANWRGQIVAVKEYTRADHMPYFEAETRQLARACHPNIIALFATSTLQRLLIMEFSEMGALDNVIENRHYSYTAAHAISWARQAADGVDHLHQDNVLHRDLKPANMLLFRDGVLLKLTDFGTSCLQRTYLTSDRGSPAWMAPEVWHTNDYNEKCDVYSWSIVFWQILSRRQPFQGMNMYQVMWAVVRNGDRLPPLKNCPSVIYNLITDCWDGDSSKRPSMAEVARKMAILQKLFPGYDQPLEKSLTPDEDSYEEDFVDAEYGRDTLIGEQNGGGQGQDQDDFTFIQADLGSLAVTSTDTLTGTSDYRANGASGNNNNNIDNMLPTLTPISGSAQSSITCAFGQQAGANGCLSIEPPRQAAATGFDANIPGPSTIGWIPNLRSPPPLVSSASSLASSASTSSFSQDERRLLEPLPTDPNGPVSQLIYDHFVNLKQAYETAQAKTEEFSRQRKELSDDLLRLRQQELRSIERAKEFQQLSANVEELTSLVTYLESAPQ